MEIIVDDQEVVANLGAELGRPRRLTAAEGFALAAVGPRHPGGARRRSRRRPGPRPGQARGRARWPRPAARRPARAGPSGRDPRRRRGAAPARAALLLGLERPRSRRASSTRSRCGCIEGHWYLDGYCHSADGHAPLPRRPGLGGAASRASRPATTPTTPSRDRAATTPAARPRRFVPGPEATVAQLAVDDDAVWITEALLNFVVGAAARRSHRRHPGRGEHGVVRSAPAPPRSARRGARPARAGRHRAPGGAPAPGPLPRRRRPESRVDTAGLGAPGLAARREVAGEVAVKVARSRWPGSTSGAVPVARPGGRVLRVAKVRRGGHAYYLEVAGNGTGTGIEAPGRWLGTGRRRARPARRGRRRRPRGGAPGDDPDTGERLGRVPRPGHGGRLRPELLRAEVGEHAARPGRRPRWPSAGARRPRARRGRRPRLRGAPRRGRAPPDGGGGSCPCRPTAVAVGRVRAPRQPRPRPPSAQPRGDGQPRPRPRGQLLRARRPRRLRPHRRPPARSTTPSSATSSRPPRGGLGAARRGRADVAGIGAEARRAFSRRAAAIAEHLSARGLGGPGRATSPAHATRPERDPSQSADDLRPGWQERAQAVGPRPRAASRPCSTGSRAGPVPGLDPGSRRRGGRASSVGAAPTVTRRDVVRAWCGSLGAGRPAPQVEEASPTGSSTSMPPTAAHAGRVEGRGVGERRHVVGGREHRSPSAGELDAAAGAARHGRWRPGAVRGVEPRPRVAGATTSGSGSVDQARCGGRWARRRRSPGAHPGRPGG